jgi:Cytotoxic translational repressor of toxin-antitoxin stability system
MIIEVAPEFEKCLKKLAKKYASIIKTDFIAFLAELEENPMLGDQIFENCRKARMAISSKGKGKSGGARIIFYYEIIEEHITLLYMYDKSDMENVRNDFIVQILKDYYNEKLGE